MTEYWRSRLSAGERDVYDQLLPAIAAGSGDVTLSAKNISAEGIKEIFACVVRDHPECYAVHPAFGVMRMWKSWNVQLRYWYEKKEIGAVDAAISAAKSKIHATKGTPEERIRQVLAMLILSCDYGVDPRDPARNQNISSVFYQHKAQCSGFSAAFQYAMDLIGVWCMQVTGEVASPQIPGGRGPHSWNIVRLGGSYYHVDATMMLGANQAKTEPLWYHNVCCSDEDLRSQGYRWDRSAVPACPTRHPDFPDAPPTAQPRPQSQSQPRSQPQPQQGAARTVSPTRQGVRQTPQPNGQPPTQQAPSGAVFTRLIDARKYLSEALDKREKVCEFLLEISQYPVEKLQKMVVGYFRELATEKNITATMQIVSHGKHHSLTIVYG